MLMVMDWDNITRTGARALGSVEYSTSWRRIIEPTGPTLSGAIDAATRCAKDGCKLDEERRMPGAGLSCST